MFNGQWLVVNGQFLVPSADGYIVLLFRFAYG